MTGVERARGRQLASDRHVSHFITDGRQQKLSPTPRNAPRDENNPAAAIIGRPAIEPGRRVKDMLDAMDHRRPIGALKNVHDALETEDIAAAVLGERFEKERQRHGVDRFAAHDRIGLDVAIMAREGPAARGRALSTVNIQAAT